MGHRGYLKDDGSLTVIDAKTGEKQPKKTFRMGVSNVASRIAEDVARQNPTATVKAQARRLRKSGDTTIHNEAIIPRALRSGKRAELIKRKRREK